jgi:hypothetical protein
MPHVRRISFGQACSDEVNRNGMDGSAHIFPRFEQRGQQRRERVFFAGEHGFDLRVLVCGQV